MDLKASIETVLDSAKTELIGPSEGISAAVFSVASNRRIVDASTFVEAWERTQAAPSRRRGTFLAETMAALVGWAQDNIDAPVVDMPIPPDAPTPADNAPPLARPKAKALTFFAQGLASLGKQWKNPMLSFTVIGNYSKLDKAAWHDFKGVFDLPISTQWKDWATANMVWMDQATFGAFLEDRVIDMGMVPSAMDSITERYMSAFDNLKPGDPIDIVRLGRGLEMTVKMEMSEARNYQTGEAALTYKEEQSTADGKKLLIPPLFFLNIPIFMDSGSYLIPVRLRYRIEGTKTKWQYELLRPECYVADCFMAAMDYLKSLGHVVIMGAPDMPTMPHAAATDSAE